MEWLLGVVFLIVMVIVIILTTRGNSDAAFVKTLDPIQNQIYESIKRERLRIFMRATVIGLIVGLSVVLATKKYMLTPLDRGCIFLATTFAIQYSWYTLTPKKNYMVLHLNKEQLQPWKRLTTYNRRLYNIGLLFGLVGYFLLGYYIGSRKSNS